jgi:glycosyltransferase involved in cell wall biosynthesis
MDGSPWGGSEELWSEAALRLLDAGHSVSASVVWWPSLSPRLLALQRRGVRVSFQKGRNLASRAYLEAMRLGWLEDYRRRWLRQQRPDVVVISQSTNCDGLEWMEACCALRIPFVTKISCNSESWWPADALADRMLTTYRAAHRILCVSKRNLEMLEAQLGERLPNAVVGWSRYTVPYSDPVPWPADDGIWRLACIARLEPSAKGQDLLFAALSRPEWKNRPVEINLFGSGPCRDTLQRLLAGYGLTNVHFKGHVDDVRQVWKAHHLLVLPSRFEGLPLSLVEAMLCARASVATDAAGGGYLCLEGETGFTVNAPSANALGDALERAWAARDRWQALGEAAYALASRTVSKDPVGDFCDAILLAANGRAQV